MVRNAAFALMLGCVFAACIQQEVKDDAEEGSDGSGVTGDGDRTEDGSDTDLDTDTDSDSDSDSDSDPATDSDPDSDSDSDPATDSDSDPATDPDPGPATDAGLDASVGDPTDDVDASVDEQMQPDAGHDAGPDPGPTWVAPQRRDCSQVPTGTRCLGGPNEVLLVAHPRGRIAAIDPDDGAYLGHIADDTYPTQPLSLGAHQATQGPDNCIYVLKDDNFNDFAIRRMDTDGSVIDDLVPFIDNNGSDVVSDTPGTIQFHNGQLYVATIPSSSDPSPPPSVATFDLTGAAIGAPVDDGSQVSGMLVLGDGSLLTSEDGSDEVWLYTTLGVAPKPIAALEQPRQLAYSGDGHIVVAQNVLGEPIVEISLETGVATRIIRPVTPGTNSACQARGVAVLNNGRWIMSGGGCSDSFGIASVDPDGATGDMNRQGMLQHLPDSIYDDETPNDGMSNYPNNYGYFGRACLPAGVITPVP